MFLRAQLELRASAIPKTRMAMSVTTVNSLGVRLGFCIGRLSPKEAPAIFATRQPERYPQLLLQTVLTSSRLWESRLPVRVLQFQSADYHALTGVEPRSHQPSFRFCQKMYLLSRAREHCKFIRQSDSVTLHVLTRASADLPTDRSTSPI